METTHIKASQVPAYANERVEYSHQQGEVLDILAKMRNHPGDFDLDLLAGCMVELVNDINSKYGNSVDLRRGAEEAIRNLSASGQFSRDEIELAQQLFSEVIGYVEENKRVAEVQEKKFNGHQFLMKNKKKKHPHTKEAKEPEFMLPNNMAVGFACALAGGLLCIVPIPGMQVVGGELIIIGGGFIFNGLVNGEKPYYVNSETGERIDFPRPNPVTDGPGGLGIKF